MADVFADAEDYGRIECPACGQNVFAILQAFREGEACPYCGLPADVARQVIEAQRKGADEKLRRAYTEAMKRALDAERQRDELLERMNTIREAAWRPL